MIAEQLSHEPGEPKRSLTVQSVDRAFDVMAELARSAQALSALELSRRVGLHRTIVHRLLRTLVRYEIAQEVGGGAYRLGPGILEFSAPYVNNLRMRRIALPHMVDLNSRGIGERGLSLTLGVPTPEHIVIIERVWNRRTSLDSFLAIPVGLPLLHSAAGRAYLAALPEERAQHIAGDSAYQELAPRLAEVRAAQGVAFAQNEITPGIAAIAVVLQTAPGVPVGTLVVAGAMQASDLTVESELSVAMMRAARIISDSLAAVAD